MSIYTKEKKPVFPEEIYPYLRGAGYWALAAGVLSFFRFLFFVAHIYQMLVTMQSMDLIKNILVTTFSSSVFLLLLAIFFIAFAFKCLRLPTAASMQDWEDLWGHFRFVLIIGILSIVLGALLRAAMYLLQLMGWF